METMQLKAVKTTVALSAILALSGCVIAVTESGGSRSETRSSWQAQQDLNRSTIHSAALGTSIEDIRGRLGEADFTEAFARDDGEYRVLFYRTHHMRSDGKTTRDETTPIAFRDGALVGFGEDFYRRLINP